MSMGPSKWYIQRQVPYQWIARKVMLSICTRLVASWPYDLVDSICEGGLGESVNHRRVFALPIVS